MSDSWEFVESLVLKIHHRNGGTLTRVSPDFLLLQPELNIDSLDLAEILVAVEKEFSVTPFESEVPPKIWGDISKICGEGG